MNWPPANTGRQSLRRREIGSQRENQEDEHPYRLCPPGISQMLTGAGQQPVPGSLGSAVTHRCIHVGHRAQQGARVHGQIPRRGQRLPRYGGKSHAEARLSKMLLCYSAGGRKYMAVLQFKSVASDEGRQRERQAALPAFSAFQ